MWSEDQEKGGLVGREAVGQVGVQHSAHELVSRGGITVVRRGLASFPPESRTSRHLLLILITYEVSFLKIGRRGHRRGLQPPSVATEGGRGAQQAEGGGG